MKASLRSMAGWDLVGSLVCALIVALSAQDRVSAELAKDLYGLATSVLAIVFSVFFAALAIIVSAGSDDFLRFLQEDGSLENLVAGFRLTLALLFVALIASILGYGLTSALAEAGRGTQPIWFLAGEIFLFSWALLATFSTTRASIGYSEFRARFLKLGGPKGP